MRRIIASVLLAVFMAMLLVACNGVTSEIQSPTPPTSDPPEPSAPASVQPTTEPTAEPSDSSAQIRYPIPEDSQFYGRFEESDDAWMDANGNIWLGDLQFTFDKGGAYIDDEPDEPVDPASVKPKLPDFQANQMKVGVYPAEWDGVDMIRFTELADALVAFGSNQKLQGTREQLATVESNLNAMDGGFIAWNNGAVSVGLFFTPDPGDVVYLKMQLIAWHIYETDPTTGDVSFDRIEILDIANRLGALPLAYFSRLPIDIMEPIWDAMARLDTAVSL